MALAFITNRFKIAFLVPNFKFNKIDAFIVLPLFRFINITFSTYVCGFREKEKLGSDMIVAEKKGSTKIKIDDGNVLQHGNNMYPTREYKMNCKIKIIESYDWNKDISSAFANMMTLRSWPLLTLSRNTVMIKSNSASPSLCLTISVRCGMNSSMQMKDAFEKSMPLMLLIFAKLTIMPRGAPMHSPSSFVS